MREVPIEMPRESDSRIRPTSYLPAILDVGQGGLRYHLPAERNGVPVQAVVDTGADVTVIATHVANQLPELDWSSPAQLQNFTGGAITAKGPTTVQMRVGPKQISIEVFSAPLVEECILGNDALTALGAIIDCRAQCVILQGEFSVSPPPAKRARGPAGDSWPCRSVTPASRSQNSGQQLQRRRGGWRD